MTQPVQLPNYAAAITRGLLAIEEQRARHLLAMREQATSDDERDAYGSRAQRALDRIESLQPRKSS